jgi:hypothetical protein
MLAGDYTQALMTLRQAVSSADHSSQTYAYALYDLGRTMLLSGNAEGAIPVLRKRLSIPIETATVQQTLDQALRAAGALAPTTPAPSTTAPSTSTTTQSQTTTTPTTPTRPTGGAGISNQPPSHGRGHTPGDGNQPGAGNGTQPGKGDHGPGGKGPGATGPPGHGHGSKPGNGHGGPPGKGNGNGNGNGSGGAPANGGAGLEGQISDLA